MEKIGKEELLECKKEILKGKSISSIAKEIGIDRKTLKNQLMQILTPEEQSELEEKLQKNFRRNRISARREKRNQAEESYKQSMKRLVQVGVKSEDIEKIFSKMAENKHTTMARDTFAIKLLAMLEYFGQRSDGIAVGKEGYISKDDVIKMILTDGKIMSNDIETKIKPICKRIEQVEKVEKEDVNTMIKTKPQIFRNAYQRVDMHLTMGEQFLVHSGSSYMSLSEYIIRETPYILSMNPKKFFGRLCYMKDRKGNTILEKIELQLISKEGFKDKENNIGDKELQQMYPFPEYDKKEPKKFRREIEQIIKQRNIVKEYDT